MTGQHLSYRDRIRGILVGGAVGDALGAPVEFSSLATIRQQYGSKGITEFAAAYGGPGHWTDDTQMTLFTVEGLIDAQRTGGDPTEAIWSAYRRWHRTQMADGPFGEGLSAMPQMHTRRAPGFTCLSACSAMEPGTVDRAINDSKGCGGVMRVAPIGAVAEDPFGLATAAAAMTHGHPSGWLASGALAVIISQVMAGASRRAAVETGLAAGAQHPRSGEVQRHLERALELAETASPAAETVERLGGGWVAEEALAIAVYCFLVADDFDQAVILGANHSGDSDSTASIAGQLYGAFAGGSVIPARWTQDLEMADVIARMADRLAAAYPA